MCFEAKSIGAIYIPITIKVRFTFTGITEGIAPRGVAVFLARIRNVRAIINPIKNTITIEISYLILYNKGRLSGKRNAIPVMASNTVK